MNFHHLGIACKDINQTAEKYSLLGYTRGEQIFDPLQNINIRFLTHPEMPLVELLSPADKKSPIVQILEKNGTTPYHTCYSVTDITEAIGRLKKQQYIVVSTPKIACAIDNHRVAFLYHKDMGLIELVEE